MCIRDRACVTAGLVTRELERPPQNVPYLSVHVFSTKVLFLRLLLETEPPFYAIIRVKRRSLAACRAKAVPRSLYSYFKTLSIGPAQGIEPGTSFSAVERSTD